jgi:lysophospholipase L1-like esterase
MKEDRMRRSAPGLRWAFVIGLAAFVAPAAGAGETLEPMAAFTPGARVLFQGDSITDGNRGRSADPNHILGHGYAFIIAAKFGAGHADRGLTFINRGVSGNTVRDLEKRWTADTLDLKPDLLSVLIGVNDTGRGVPLDEYEQTCDRLLTAAREANPRLKLVLGDPFGLPTGAKKSGWEAWSASLRDRQAVVGKLAKKHGAVRVLFQQAFDEVCKRAPAEHWMWDGVHPTYAGHQVMADAWVRAVNDFWPAEPKR